MSTRKFIRKQKIYRFKVIQLPQRNHAERRKRGIAYDLITTFRYSTTPAPRWVAGRLAQLRLALRTTGDQEEAQRLRRRIAELRPMLEQCRRLTQLTARYYDRSFCGYGEYRI